MLSQTNIAVRIRREDARRYVAPLEEGLCVTSAEDAASGKIVIAILNIYINFLLQQVYYMLH